MNRLALLWDESQIWGLLVHRALAAWGIPTDVIRGRDIPEGRLKKNPPAALIAPGGFASRKHAALGGRGAAAVRDYVSSGGSYLGFCGGAGLALSGETGLGLCPWRRETFSDRLRHLVSGHVRLDVPSEAAASPFAPAASSLIAPVWWPGQFEVAATDEPRVLARYAGPAEDFYMADLQLSALPADTLDDWEKLYGVSLKPDFLLGKPCAVEGRLGRGRYVLSYAHLETPASPQANAWLWRILGELAGAGASAPPCPLPDWDVAAEPPAWDDPVLLQAARALDETLRLGADLLLLFKRTPWLFGWRMGLPGGSLNNLHALLRQALASQPDAAARDWWRGRSAGFRDAFALFRRGLVGYLLAERLAMTASRLQPGCVPAKSLADQRKALFGPPPGYGGLYGELIDSLDELVWRGLIRTTD